MSDITLSYKGSDILELSDSGSATLKTGGTYCEADIEVEYVKPSGGGYARKYTVTTANSCTKFSELSSMLFGSSNMFCTAIWVSAIPSDGVYIPLIFHQKINNEKDDNVVRTLSVESSQPVPYMNYENASFAKTMPSGVTYDVYVYLE